MIKHADDCGWHVDQYPWECTCGAIPRKAAMDELIAADADLAIGNEKPGNRERIEQLTAEVERLRAALVAVTDYGDLPAVQIARAALEGKQ